MFPYLLASRTIFAATAQAEALDPFGPPHFTCWSDLLLDLSQITLKICLLKQVYTTPLPKWTGAPLGSMLGAFSGGPACFCSPLSAFGFALLAAAPNDAAAALLPPLGLPSLEMPY